ncbi:MAG: hypothetical protein IKZ82_13960 [Clostridia bacterium]|nr:hypothetical protein [Clostridia bacterium]
MKIFIYELKKLLRFPLMWVLAALSIGLNALLMHTPLGYPEFTRNLREMYRVLSAGIHEWEAFRIYTEYREHYSGVYNELDMLTVLEEKKDDLGFEPTGSYAEFIRGNYEKLQKRVEEIRNGGETDGPFYPGGLFGIHGALYSVLSFAIVEMLIITCFSVLYLMDFERISHTNETVLSSAVGRRIMGVKLGAGLLFGMLLSVIILAASLADFLALVPMEGLWSTSVSAFTVMERELFITFFPLTIAQELMLGIAAALMLTLIMGLIVGAAQYFCKNSYLVTVCTAAIFFGAHTAIKFVNNAGIFTTAIRMTPAALLRSCGKWFIADHPAIAFAGSELWTLGIWGAIALAALLFGKMRFMRKDI